MASLRRALPDDIDAIAKVHIAAWITSYRGLVPDAMLERQSFRRRQEWWRGVIDEHCEQVAVVEEDRQLVGVAHFGVERENDPDYRGELDEIYLLRDYHRRGLGRRLVGASVEGLLQLGHRSMLVWLLSQNPARHFYEKLGGKYLRGKTVDLGGSSLQESAYGWEDIHSLAEGK